MRYTSHAALSGAQQENAALTTLKRSRATDLLDLAHRQEPLLVNLFAHVRARIRLGSCSEHDRALVAAAVSVLLWLVASTIVITNPAVAAAVLVGPLLLMRKRVTLRDCAVVAVLSSPVLVFQSIFMAPLAVALGCAILAFYRALVGKMARTGLLPVTVFFLESAFCVFLRSLRKLTPLTIDSQMVALDAKWFHGLSLAVWHWSTAHLYVWLPFETVYFFLPCAIVLMLDGHERQTRGLAGMTMLAMGISAVPIYMHFPAVGPAHVYDSLGLFVESLAVCNCTPSLHVAWTIFMWRATPCSRRRTALGIFALLTAISTLTTGEHYVIDLCAAVPFAAFWVVVYRAASALKQKELGKVVEEPAFALGE